MPLHAAVATETFNWHEVEPTKLAGHEYVKITRPDGSYWKGYLWGKPYVQQGTSAHWLGFFHFAAIQGAPAEPKRLNQGNFGGTDLRFYIAGI